MLLKGDVEDVALYGLLRRGAIEMLTAYPNRMYKDR